MHHEYMHLATVVVRRRLRSLRAAKPGCGSWLTPPRRSEPFPHRQRATTVVAASKNITPNVSFDTIAREWRCVRSFLGR